MRSSNRLYLCGLSWMSDDYDLHVGNTWVSFTYGKTWARGLRIGRHAWGG